MQQIARPSAPQVSKASTTKGVNCPLRRHTAVRSLTFLLLRLRRGLSGLHVRQSDGGLQSLRYGSSRDGSSRDGSATGGVERPVIKMSAGRTSLSDGRSDLDRGTGRRTCCVRRCGAREAGATKAWSPYAPISFPHPGQRRNSTSSSFMQGEHGLEKSHAK